MCCLKVMAATADRDLLGRLVTGKIRVGRVSESAVAPLLSFVIVFPSRFGLPGSVATLLHSKITIMIPAATGRIATTHRPSNYPNLPLNWGFWVFFGSS